MAAQASAHASGLNLLVGDIRADRIDFNSWIKLDISYIENWSLTLDVDYPEDDASRNSR
jgi:lipopolysaccharide/colanic/teichoic acid biosynthesis glycosyltransferase